MSYTLWKNSPGANTAKIIGIILTLSGIYSAAYYRYYVFGIIAGLIGIVLIILSYSIHKKEMFDQWKIILRQNGIDDRIAASMEDALAVYNSNPGKRTLKYIEKLNPSAGAYILAQLAKK